MIALTSRYHYYYDQQSSNDGKMMLLPAGTIGAQATIQGKSNHLDFIRIEILMGSIIVPNQTIRTIINHLLRRVAPRRRSNERGKRTAFDKR